MIKPNQHIFPKSQHILLIQTNIIFEYSTRQLLDENDYYNIAIR